MSVSAWVRAARPWWRLFIMLSLLLSYNAVLWAELAVDVSIWDPVQRDRETLTSLVILVLMLVASALFFALDFVQVALLLSLQWLSYLVGAIILFWRWWVQSGQPRFWWHEQLWRPFARTSTQVLVYALAIATLFLLILLASARQLNRSERATFINAYVLLSRVAAQERRIERVEIELLGIFSNPRVTAAVVRDMLRPLALGQEIKFLLRAVPNDNLAIEAAASLADVAPALRKHNPRALHFSGHSVSNSLVFEQPNGQLELPPPADLIAQLTERIAPRLRLIFLNGCKTAELGHTIVSAEPRLAVVCWATIVEDAAARAFAQGFYDAIGDHLKRSDDPPDLLTAFRSGLERFATDGGKLGNPEHYLHQDPHHPHMLRPDFRGCEGCQPPVHGVVVALSSVRGTVSTLHIAGPEVDAITGSMGLRDSVDPAGSCNSGMLPSVRSVRASFPKEICSVVDMDMEGGDEGGAGAWVPVTLEQLRRADTAVLLGHSSSTPSHSPWMLRRSRLYAPEDVQVALSIRGP